MKETIAIIGGGFTGLTTAYRLSKKGNKVSIFEKSEFLGGLAGGFKIEGSNLEKAYHHIFRTDKDIIELTKELKIDDKLEWHNSSIGLYYQKKLYPFLTPTDLLKFPPLELTDKLRLGLTALYLQKTNDYEKFIQIPATKWMKEKCGERAYKIIWEPLLKGKFHNFYNQVSMAWLWARIHTRANSKEKGDSQEKLGYFNGGFDVVTQALMSGIRKNGGRFFLKSDISRIEQEKYSKVGVVVNGQKRYFDKVVACVPNGALAKMIDKRKFKEYINQLISINYLSALVVVFSSEQSLSKYYWHNINDLKSPFLAFIQHTNLIDKSRYNNKHVYYLGTYLPETHKYFTDADEAVYGEFFRYLKKMFPDFDEKKIRSKFIFRLKNAQHVVDTGYTQKIPDYGTPIKNLYLANFSQIFPEDRGTNFAVREGNKIAKLI